jgi:hypothetical protein
MGTTANRIEQGPDLDRRWNLLGQQASRFSVQRTQRIENQPLDSLNGRAALLRRKFLVTRDSSPRGIVLDEIPDAARSQCLRQIDGVERQTSDPRERSDGAKLETRVLPMSPV